MESSSLTGGFAQPPQDSANAFRGIMRAMACPGTICDVLGAVPPAPLSVAAGTVLITLCDHDTSVHLTGRYDTQAIRDWITFQTGAPLAPAADAQFVLGIGKTLICPTWRSERRNTRTDRRPSLSNCRNWRLKVQR